MISYFDFLETKFTEANMKMATKDPNDVTVPRQAAVNGTLALVGLSRSIIKWAYVVYLLVQYLLIRAHLKKSPEFKSSIPNQKPANGKPDLAVVASGPNTNLQD